MLDDGTPHPPADGTAGYRRLTAEESPGDAVEFFTTRAVGLPPEFAAQARSSPAWAGLEEARVRLAYDAEIMGDYLLPKQRASQVTASTIVLSGDASFGFLTATAPALARALPDGQAWTLVGQTHDVDPDVPTPVLAQFFAG